jgi:cobalt-zinc-cadmium efflux system protein
MIAEVAGGLFTGSLALLADAGHMFTDAVALGLGLFAWVVSERAPNPAKTFGYYRVEILVSLANGLALWGVVIFVAREALIRLHTPPIVKGLETLLIGTIGLLLNTFNAWNLAKAKNFSLNIKGAYLHVLSDVMGSLGVIGSAAVMMTTGWKRADPLASLFICALILFSTWGLIRESVNILMEGTPGHIDTTKVISALEALPGVQAVHDLHIWTLTTGIHCLSAHVQMRKEADQAQLLGALGKTLSEKFSITHTTLQLDPPDHPGCLPTHF